LAAHADDNPPLRTNTLGFALLDTVQRFSRSRGKSIARRHYKLTPFGALSGQTGADDRIGSKPADLAAVNARQMKP
jgi:hypothetical protein